MTDQFISKEVRPVRIREMDNSGYVFKVKKTYFRAIYHAEAKRFDDLIDSGLLDKLSEMGLIPKTKKSDRTIDDPQVMYLLEHEDAGPVVYPFEWSFTMLKDAALLVLRINEVAREYGFETKDAHWYNIIFQYARPKFVDIGSFIPCKSNQKSWRALRDFKRSYYYPLYSWSHGDRYLAQLSLMRASERISDEDFYSKKYSLVRLLPSGLKRKFFNSWYEYKLLSYQSEKKINTRLPGWKGKYLLKLRNEGWLPFQAVSFKRLRNQINNLKAPKLKTRWGNYHSHFSDDDIINKAYPRFNRIAELMTQYEATNAIEIGGNQGVFSRYLLAHSSIDEIICTDYDEPAIDTLYNVLKTKDYKINPVVLDFAFPKVTDIRPKPYERLKSEAVIALAITHHLILTQRINIDQIFNNLKKYTNRYVFVEFMPLGIHSNSSKYEVNVPDWYTKEWFQDNFEQVFNLLHVEQLEKNRILFIGEI